MKRFFAPTPVYIGKRKLLPDSLRDLMSQEDNIIVFLAGDKIEGKNPSEWVDEYIHEPLRERTTRERKSGRYK